MSARPRLFINGFGRIGRTVLRQLLQGGSTETVDIVGVNDIAPSKACTYLLRYDSVYGPFPQPIVAEEGGLQIAGRHIPFYCTPDLRALDLRGVDVVLECTGQNDSRDFVQAGIEAGARDVLISGPSAVADRTIVLGANEQALGEARIVSNASCTTNAIAPLLRLIDLGLGIDRAHVTTIHCYTGSQPTVDRPGFPPERGRAAAVSMVPTSTSAAHQIALVLPEFEGRLSVAAVRVPCISVSAIDATLQIADDPGECLTRFLREAFASSPLVGITEDPCVSTDFRGRPESVIIALPETCRTGPRQLRIFGWYDNEWGFSARMIDMARHLAARRR